MTGIVAGLALVLAAASAGPAESRTRLGGAVTSADGTPWKGVDVVLLSRQVPWAEDVGTCDLVRARTNERGRFRVFLLPGRTYSCWAISDDGRRGSHVLEGVAAGRSIRLKEGPPLGRVKARVEGIEAWSAFGQVRLFALSTTKNLHAEELQLDPRGSVELPRLPGPRVVVEARLDGKPFWSQELRLTFQGPPGVLLPLPRPRPLLVEVRDQRTGNPIPEARVLVEARDRWWHRGTSDGRGQCRIPWPASVRGVRLVVSVTGHGERTCHTRLDDGSRPLRVELMPMPSLSGRLLWTRDRPAARHPILYEAPLGTGKGSWVQPPRPRVVWTGPDGSFDIPTPDIRARRPLQVRYRLTTVPGSQEVPGNAAPLGLPIVLRAGLTKAEASGRPDDIGDIVVAELPEVTLHVIRADGAPVRHVRLLAFEEQRKGAGTCRVLEYGTDRRGHLSLRLPPGHFSLGALDDHSLGVVTLELPLPPSRQNEPVTVRMSQPVTIAGRVVNDAGKPVAGARISWNLDFRSLTGAWSPLLTRLRQHTVKTASNGAFELRVPKGDVTYWLWANVHAGGRSHSSERNVMVEVGERGASEVEIVIPSAPAPGR